MATAHPQSQAQRNHLHVPRQIDSMSAFARMPPPDRAREKKGALTLRERRRIPHDLAIIIPQHEQYIQMRAGDTTASYESYDSEQEDQLYTAEQYGYGHGQYEAVSNAEIAAAEWFGWLKMMVPDPTIQWYVTENRNEVYRFYVDYQIMNSLSTHDKGPALQEQSLSITKLPLEVLTMIFAHLDTPDQICLGLTNKSFANISQYINGGEGVTYNSSVRLEILWRLESWMTADLRLCMTCGKYFPLAPMFWKERKRQGRCRTRSVVYGRVDEDFRFQEETCPECAAAILWGNIAMSHMGIQMAVL
ncbi:hypothetical protein FQN51_002593 [Onygenales sp. PD_10]|nr:hypothetical protein FQN51_002593 [Onygenales sp. PD_10]